VIDNLDSLAESNRELDSLDVECLVVSELVTESFDSKPRKTSGSPGTVHNEIDSTTDAAGNASTLDSKEMELWFPLFVPAPNL
jgi:hypothetical protein